MYFGLCQSLSGQDLGLAKVHSHNDYNQHSPFWTAYHAGAESIEADVFLKNNELYVTHAEDEIINKRTLDDLYLIPLDSICRSDRSIVNNLILLIDIKSEAYSTLEFLLETLKNYPGITDHPQIKIVISGNRPEPSDFPEYPSFIYFDYQSRGGLKEEGILQKIAMVSLDFGDYSKWDGQGQLPDEDQLIVMELAKKANAMEKPFRFWGTPDTPKAWNILYSLGVDYINTDHPVLCKRYFKEIR